ncbi:MAG: DbpA RNA binding domain-containing protein [Gemmatimonadota bacterium]
MMDTTEFPAIQRLLEARSPAERLPEAVEGLAAAIERGHHMALVAGEGAHLCRLYSAAAIHDLAGDDPGLALILVASPDRARRLARSIERTGSALGWETVLWTEERSATGAGLPERAVVVATPSRLLADIRSGVASLSNLRLLAIDDVASLEAEWPAVEGLLQAGGTDLRRIAATHRRDRAFDGLVERLLPRARKWPGELFPADPEDRVQATGAPLRYATAASHDGRLVRLVELLHFWAAETTANGATVWCDGPDASAGIADALSIEGFEVATGAASAGISIHELTNAPVADAGGGPAAVFGLPWTAEELTAALGGAKPRAVIVAPRHVAQLEVLGARVGWPVRGLPDTPRRHRGEVEAFRATIEDTLVERDLAGGALLIEPLIEEHGFDRVSAALATLLRDRGPGKPEPAPAPPGRETRGSRVTPGPTSRDAERATRSTWSKVFVNVGRQDGVAPGDFVGAITGETGAVGGQIGKIEIKQKFSLIDIDSMVVDEVLRGLSGKQIKGRDVVARLDRDG